MLVPAYRMLSCGYAFPVANIGAIPAPGWCPSGHDGQNAQGKSGQLGPLMRTSLVWSLFFITRRCLWKLTFVVEGVANVISALSWQPPCWDFTNEKLTQNLRPEQKSLKYTNMDCVSRAKYSPIWNISHWAKIVRIYKCIGNSFSFLVRAENAVTVGFAWGIEWECFCKLNWLGMCNKIIALIC